ncbi:hypothetical protein [Nocardia fusca]|uniref:hypothetical protein n=1 Tax=Nocardia fusca TaxID=941183 RepID=UPI000B084D91|nr:hypothetical protein [Nocardia fusca]
MRGAYTRINDLITDISHRMIYSGNMVVDCFAAEARGVGGHLTGHANRADRDDERQADLIGGIPAGTDFGSRSTVGVTESYTLRAGLDSNRVTFHDFYEHVRRHELPEHIDPGGREGADWSVNRAWGRAVAAKQDHLRAQGVAGREFAEAMWKWKNEMEREARGLDATLEFPPETASREPYLERLYRGDRRSKEVIEDEGFRPRSTMTDSTHSWVGSDGPGADDWVCLSQDPAVAARFPLVNRRFSLGVPGEVYVVHDVTGAVDKTGESRVGFNEKLVVVPGGVPADKIEGTLIDRNDPGKGIDPNPNFRPHEPTPIRPPRADAGWDNVYRDPS